MSLASVRSVWLMLVALSCFALTSLVLPFSEYDWHDQQRIAQLLLLVFVCCFVLFSGSCLGGAFINPLLAIFLLGGASVLSADILLWAARDRGMTNTVTRKPGKPGKADQLRNPVRRINSVTR